MQGKREPDKSARRKGCEGGCLVPGERAGEDGVVAGTVLEETGEFGGCENERNDGRGGQGGDGRKKSQLLLTSAATAAPISPSLPAEGERNAGRDL